MVKVYLFDGGHRRLVGRADVPDDHRAVFHVPMSGAVSSATERFIVGVVTHSPDGGGDPVVERAVLAAPGQWLGALPGWAPLAS